MVFATEATHPESTVYVRMFAPMLGVAEDPATGSANGALGAYLVRHRVVPVMGTTAAIVSEQGEEMGRQSTVYVQVVLAAEGVVRLDAPNCAR
jgi:trans-2,3-dihydro-3-hydroxyanthranilate isomerase